MPIPRSAKLTMTGSLQSFATALPLLAGYVAGKSIQVRWVQVVTPNTNSANIYVGGAEVSATGPVGFPIPPGWAGQLFPVDGSDNTSYYELLGMFAVGTSGDVLELLFG